VVGAVVAGVGAVLPGTTDGDVEGDDADGPGLASVGEAESDGVGVGVPDDGVSVGVGVGVGEIDEDEPPRLLNVVPDTLAFAIGCPSRASLTWITAMAATKTPAAASRTGFHRIRCHTASRTGCGSGAGSPGGSATSGCGLGAAGARVCRTTRVRLTRAARLREFE
jgi:hypothetical protein